MIFKLLTTIVFISEIIIAYTLISKLVYADRMILQINENIEAMRPGIKDVGDLIKKISAQCVEFSNDFVNDIIKKRDESIINQLNKLIIAILLLRLNSKFIKKILKSKHFKLLSKGLSLLKYMV